MGQRHRPAELGRRGGFVALLAGLQPLLDDLGQLLLAGVVRDVLVDAGDSPSSSVQTARTSPWPRTSGPDGESATRLTRAASISCPTVPGLTRTQRW